MPELPHFFCEKRLQWLFAECKKWEGVRYRHMGNNEHGIDCTKLIAHLLVKFDVLEKVEDNIYYSRDWFIHSKEEIALREIERHLREYSSYLFETIDYEESKLCSGDIIFMANESGMACHHTVFYLGESKIFHAIDGIGCNFAFFGDHWKNKSRFILRILDNNPWQQA